MIRRFRFHLRRSFVVPVRYYLIGVLAHQVVPARVAQGQPDCTDGKHRIQRYHHRSSMTDHENSVRFSRRTARCRQQSVHLPSTLRIIGSHRPEPSTWRRHSSANLIPEPEPAIPALLVSFHVQVTPMIPASSCPCLLSHHGAEDPAYEMRTGTAGADGRVQQQNAASPRAHAEARARATPHRRFAAPRTAELPPLPPILRLVGSTSHAYRAPQDSAFPWYAISTRGSAAVPPASAAHLLLAVSRTPYRRGLRVARWRSPMRPRRGLCPSSSRLL